MGGRSEMWSSAEDQITTVNEARAEFADGAGGVRPAPVRGEHAQSADAPVDRLGTVLRRRLMIADSVAVLTGFAIAFLVQDLVRPGPDTIFSWHLLLMVGSLPGFALGAAMARLHRARNNERPREELLNILRATGTGVALLVVLAFGVQFKHLSRFWIVLVAIGVAGALTVERQIARRIFARMRAEGRLNRRIVIVGTDAHAIGLLHTYQRNPALGYEVVGFVGDEDIGTRGGIGVIGSLGNLMQVLEEHRANGVVVSLCSIGDQQVNRLTRRLTDSGYHVALSSALTDIDVTRLLPQQVDGRTMIYVEPVIRHGWRAAAKRFFDVAMALGIIVLTLPVWLAAMIGVRLTSAGPVFFRQERVGRNGELFTLFKLRTMVADAEERRDSLLTMNEADGPLFKIAHDPRVTRIGHWLRKYSIDELPQLICVLRGEMSMVGPRPALPTEVEEWDEPLHDRLRVPPGLTGMWQISGRSAASFEQYRRLDLYYVDNWSLSHDLRICVKTLGVVVSGRGAS